MNAFENYAHFNLWHKFENSFGCAYNALGDAGKSIYTDFLTFQIIPHLECFVPFRMTSNEFSLPSLFSRSEDIVFNASSVTRAVRSKKPSKNWK